MTEQKERKFTSGCLIGAIIASVLVIIMGGVLVGVLALIAAPTLLNAADKAKQGAVKANTAAAASTVTTLFLVKEYPADMAALTAIKELNEAGTPDDNSDDAYSPFNRDLPAFSQQPGPGVVTIKAIDPVTVELKAYGKNEEVIKMMRIDSPSH